MNNKFKYLNVIIQRKINVMFKKKNCFKNIKQNSFERSIFFVIFNLLLIVTLFHSRSISIFF